jgi:metal-sulfur cluster biosynthetic enzyme
MNASDTAETILREAPYWAALGDVLDPELPISIVDLGLVYGLRVNGDHIEVDLTFTAAGCPCIGFIKDDIRERLLQEMGVERVTIREVWNPPWTKARVSAAGRAALKRFGVSL